MSATATVPVTITPEAAARVAELGMQKELDLMLEHTRQTVPGLRAIRVIWETCHETGDELGLTIEAWREVAYSGTDDVEGVWGTWLLSHFPPDVVRYVALLTFYGDPHEW
jgi:hypothetical protein